MTPDGLPLDMTSLDPIPSRLRDDRGRPSAVLVGLTQRQDVWHVIMTERAHHLAHHAGQISFPGGKVDEVDTSLVDTALREAQEEVALPETAVEVLGGLNTVVSPVGFVVQPVVGLVSSTDSLKPAPDEVAQVLVLPLAPLLDPARHRRETYLREGQQRSVWVIDHDHHYIWGLSATILVDLASRSRLT